ncbi:MAG: hypothetical protein H6707_00365 [Deltaproteobacteria bacterium]|nr:hypothetical protein [Deltaproteobacteria bacterium]
MSSGQAAGFRVELLPKLARGLEPFDHIELRERVYNDSGELVSHALLGDK